MASNWIDPGVEMASITWFGRESIHESVGLVDGTIVTFVWVIVGIKLGAIDVADRVGLSVLAVGFEVGDAGIMVD